MKYTGKAAINHLLVKLFNRILVIEEKALASSEFADINMTGIHVIEAIGLDGDRQMAAIAAALNITAGTLTHTVNNLVRKGYVERVNAPHDKRVYLLQLTEKGTRAYEHHLRFHDELVSFALSEMAVEEEAALVSAMEKVVVFFEHKYEETKDSMTLEGDPNEDKTSH